MPWQNVTLASNSSPRVNDWFPHEAGHRTTDGKEAICRSRRKSSWSRWPADIRKILRAAVRVLGPPDPLWIVRRPQDDLAVANEPGLAKSSYRLPCTVRQAKHEGPLADHHYGRRRS